jgi:hypothetical protein
MTCFLFQACLPPQCSQVTVPGLSSVAAKTSSSITTPVTLSFFVVGHLTKIRLITAGMSHNSRQKLAQSCFVCRHDSGTTAKTRAGNPDPPFGFGNVAKIIAPASGT